MYIHIYIFIEPFPNRMSTQSLDIKAISERTETQQHQAQRAQHTRLLRPGVSWNNGGTEIPPFLGNGMIIH